MGAANMLQSINREPAWAPDPADPYVARFRAERARRVGRERAKQAGGRARVILLEVGSFPSREDVVAAAAAHYGEGTPVGLSRIAVLRIAAHALRIRAREDVRRLDPGAVQVIQPEWDPEARPRRGAPAQRAVEPELEEEDPELDRAGDGETEVENQTMSTLTAPSGESAAARPLGGKEDEERVREYLRGLFAGDRRLVEDRANLRDRVRENLGLEVHSRTLRRLVDEAYALAGVGEAGVSAEPAAAVPEPTPAEAAWDTGPASWRPGADTPAQPELAGGGAPVLNNRLLGLAGTNGHGTPTRTATPVAEPPYQALQYGITSTGEAHLAIEVTVPVPVALRLMREFAAAMADEVMSSAGGAR